MAMQKVFDYLKEKGVEIDEALLKYVENGVDISEKDEFKHDFKIDNYPEHHNESWYFNFIDFDANVQLVTRVSLEMGAKKSDVMLIIIIDRKTETYLNRLIIDGWPESDIYGDKRVKYECLEPMKKWHVTAKHRKFEVDVIFEARFPPFNYLSHEDPLEAFKKYGVEMLQVAAQQHYEQGMKVTGTVKIKEKREVKEVRQINCYGHRDHSWGTRDWVNIDRWNWISAQFDDCTINAARVEVFGKILTSGFISTSEGNEHVTNVEVTTECGYKDDERAPKSSTFKLTTKNRQVTLTSHTWKSLYLKRPSERGLTEIYEQIVNFEMDGKKGTGISEYMSSTKKEGA
ncbi:MAG: DUF7064 domain-containing protein [Candidatus Helarchaeota archaeon]